MGLTVLLVLEVFFYSAFVLLLVKAAGRIDPSLGAAIYNGLAAILPLTIYLFYKARGVALPETTPAGLLYAVLAGLALVGAAILLMQVFEKGGAAYAVPLIYGGTIALSTLAGWLILRETVTPLQLTGIGIVILGLGVIVYARITAQ